MRVFAVSGVHHSGKTTTIEHLIRELVGRGYSVGTVKSVHRERFSIDRAGTNTDRHRTAGATAVAARSDAQTAIMWSGRLDYEEILRLYDTDWVIIEGAHREAYPRIVAAGTEHHIEQRFDGSTFLICGAVAQRLDSWRGVPVMDATTRAKEVVDLLERSVPEYDRPKEGQAVQRTLEPGPEERFEVEVRVDGEELHLAPFVQDFVSRTVLGMLSSLKGYKPGSEFTIEIRRF
ncbi:MAG TPA: molybdopterin-guanine dinucleotide biosynthesis protein B [Bacillota bacterium]|nr:molybdopterin-guanine dinucleotide biosynthesis protein B [Bacillota bacterium]HOI35976.1 molybdopterin-guanine dinucleotide biosynthesis protein B [Bacillota bacterium]HPU75956.1 molybdopterin-guanine dinucleotide biosynthesis protein B [Bacillota bacterium]